MVVELEGLAGRDRSVVVVFRHGVVTAVVVRVINIDDPFNNMG